MASGVANNGRYHSDRTTDGNAKPRLPRPPVRRGPADARSVAARTLRTYDQPGDKATNEDFVPSAGSTVWIALVSVALSWLAGCTSTRVDEQRVATATVSTGDSVVVLGRRQSSDYDTEPEFISCIGKGVASAGARVVPELEFLNGFYPWFEPRTAPLSMEKLESLMSRPLVAERMRQMNLRYIVWIDGKTETTDRAGSISCAVGPGGAGCIGFGTWDRESTYEASVWDLNQKDTIARISAAAEGTSYMPALIVPVPLVARVQSAACGALSAQLEKLFQTR